MAEPIQPPITVSIIGTGTGEGGGVAPTPNGTVMQATTPAPQPNLLINVVTPVVAVVVRFVNMYLTTFVGVLTAAGFGGDKLIGATDFHALIVAGNFLALSVSGVGTIKNVITIFARLEGKWPLATGSI